MANLMRVLLLVANVFCLTATQALAQDAVSDDKALAELHYHPVGKLIYLPVSINGTGPYMFCFDSGAPNSIVDAALARKLSLREISKGTIRGAGRGEVAAEDAGEVQFKVGGLITKVPNAMIVDLSKVPVPERMDGLLGAEFLQQYVVRIDPAKDTIAFYDPKTFSYHGEGKSVPLELTNDRAYVQMGLSVKPGEIVARRVRVDTGSEDSVDDDLVRQSSHVQKTTLGNGLGNSYEDVSGVYLSVSLGPYTFRDVWGPAGAVPIVGMELMRRFTLTFYAQRGTLYLEPNTSFGEPVPPPN